MAEDKKKAAEEQKESLVSKDLRADEAAQQEDLDLYLLNLTKKYAAMIATESNIQDVKSKFEKKFLAEQLAAIEKQYSGRLSKEQMLAMAQTQAQHKIVELAQKMTTNQYRFASKTQKIQILEQQKATANATQERIQMQMAEIAASDMHGNAKNAALKKLRQEQLAANDEAIKAEQQKRQLTIANIQQKRKDGTASRKEIDAQMDAINESFELERQQHAANIDNLNEQIALLEEKKKKGKLKDGGRIDKEIDKLKEKRDSEKDAVKQGKKDQLKEGTLANVMKGATHALNEGLKNLTDKFGNAIKEAMGTLAEHRSKIEARTQGMLDNLNDSVYDGFSRTMKSTLGLSPFVKQTDLLKKLSDAVDAGIAYNVEQRAFLATISDKIATTFNAFDSNLMRIIRLQQADTTAARMGMEASLTQFFNSVYKDTSYLTEGYDQVSQALVDANAQMSRDMSISFEFNVQKWLGSLAALGFGTDTLQTIATGINYLGSGNVQALSGNTELQNLLAMSASRAGLSYSQMLVDGIDDSQTNKLLRAMVEYLKEISEDNNAVVKAAYGDIFKFTQADLRAIANTTEEDLDIISSQSMSYASAMQSINQQLSLVGRRMSTSELIDNVFENFTFTSSEAIANQPVTAITYKVIDLIESFTGGIHLPAISVMGNMIDLSTFTIEGLAKTALFGLGALASIPSMFSSLASGGGLDLSAWGAKEYNSRGGVYDARSGGVQTMTSQSMTAVTSGSSSDQKKESLNSTQEDQDTMKKQSKESAKDEITLEVLYKSVVLDDQKIRVYDAKTYNKTKDIYTVNSDIYTKLNEEVIPVYDDSVYSKLSEIYTKLSGTLTVSLDQSALTALTPKTDTTQKVHLVKIDDTKASDKLASLIKDNTQSSTMSNTTKLKTEDDVEFTMDDLYEKLYEILNQIQFIGDSELRVYDKDVAAAISILTTRLTGGY